MGWAAVPSTGCWPNLPSDRMWKTRTEWQCTNGGRRRGLTALCEASVDVAQPEERQLRPRGQRDDPTCLI